MTDPIGMPEPVESRLGPIDQRVADLLAEWRLNMLLLWLAVVLLAVANVLFVVTVMVVRS